MLVESLHLVGWRQVKFLVEIGVVDFVLQALCYGWVHMAHAKGLGREIAWKLLVQK
jgi:hypothetical protein